MFGWLSPKLEENQIMSPHAGFILTEEIVPRLKTAIPHIKLVGAEDKEELLQDAIVVAAQMLDRLEQIGKQVTPGNVAYYTLLHMKSGRRSTGSGRTDVMSSGGQLDGNSCVLSFQEPAGIDPETGEEIALGELLSCDRDDPALHASRVLDWEEFIDTHDERYRSMIQDIGEGRTLKDTAQAYGGGFSRIYQLKQKLARELREFMGEEAIADSARVPHWRGTVRADFERAACRADRRRG